MIARNEITTWGAKQVSDIFKDSDSETFYVFNFPSIYSTVWVDF